MGEFSENKDSKIKLECLIDGKLLKFDGCSNNDLDISIEHFKEKGMVYIGTSNTSYYNGVKDVWDEQFHFFVRKTKLKDVFRDALHKMSSFERKMIYVSIGVSALALIALLFVACIYYYRQEYYVGTISLISLISCILILRMFFKRF